MRWQSTFCAVLVLLLAGCQATVGPGPVTPASGAGKSSESADPLAPILPAATAADRIVNRAKEEARAGVVYDASYRKIAYPGGDVPADRGACTDVVVRALRAAGCDLQRQIHEDAGRRPGRYPRLNRPGGDANIDHRRAANHIAFLKRFGRSLPISTTGPDLGKWLPGDLVYWKLDNGLDHCGVISNVRNADGLPLVIHNIGVARQEDRLTTWRIIAHFRYPAR